MFLQSTLLRLSGDLKDRIAVGTAIGLGIAACDVGQAYVAAKLVSGIMTNMEATPLVQPLIIIASLMMARALLNYLKETEGRKTGALVKLKVRRRIFDHLALLGPSFAGSNRTGNLTAIAVESVEHLEPYCAKYLPTFVVAIVVTIAAVGYITSLNVWIAGLLLAFMVTTPLLPQFWYKKLEPRNEARWAQWSELASEFLDAAQGVTTLKIFNAARRKGEELHQKSLKLYMAQMVQLYLALIVESFTVVTTLGGTAIVVSVGALMVANGALPFPALVLILFACREIFKPWIDLSTYWHLGINANSGARKIAALLDETPVVVEASNPRRVKPLATAPSVQFEDVSFTYPSRSELAVKNVSITAKPGQSIAIVGRSGSGKSTLAMLLQRHRDCGSGSIRIDGTDIRDFDLDSLRSSIAIVAQETYLFAGSIADNIMLGRPDATPQQLTTVINNAGLSEFVESLPQGVMTDIGERGLSVSGGQRQRIAIARAFLKDAPLLILDEATSNVDVESEAGILAALERLRKGRTTITIAHRLHAVMDADRIFVMDKGSIAEEGKHRQLSASTSTYAKLIKAQEEVLA